MGWWCSEFFSSISVDSTKNDGLRKVRYSLSFFKSSCRLAVFKNERMLESLRAKGTSIRADFHEAQPPIKHKHSELKDFSRLGRPTV